MSLEAIVSDSNSGGDVGADPGSGAGEEQAAFWGPFDGAISAGSGLSDDPELLARAAGNLAKGLSDILTDAIRKLEMHLGKRVLVLQQSVERQQEGFSAAIEGLAEIKERLATTIGELGSAALVSPERYEQMAVEITSLHQSSARHESTTQDLSCSVSERLDAVLGRLDIQQQELASLKLPVSEIEDRVDALLQRLDGQTEAVHAVCQAQARWEEALDHVIEILTRARTASAPVGACTSFTN